VARDHRVQDIQNGAGFKPGMLHAVEIRFCGENIQELLSRIRSWCARTEAQPTTFRYWLSEPDSLLRVNFERKEQADAFAQAFDGLVLV
jgi:hypothetical protein